MKKLKIIKELSKKNRNDITNSIYFNCIKDRLPKIPEKYIKKTKKKNNRNYFSRNIKSYSSYIKSSYWEKRKNKYYKTHKKICSICFSSENINLHHMSYEHLGKELDTELVALCKSCHEKYHQVNGVQTDMKEKTNEFIIDSQEELELFTLIKNLC